MIGLVPKIRKSQYIVLIALFSSLPVALRMAFIMSGLSIFVQWTNIIGIFAFLGAIFLGPMAGLFIGLIGFFLSDMVSPYGVSPFTLIMGGTMGIIAFASSFLIVYKGQRNILKNIILFVKLYILMFIYDIITSILGYLLWGLNINDAIFYGIVGLFIPLYGGFLWFVGPITEASTAIFTILLLDPIHKVLDSQSIYYSDE